MNLRGSRGDAGGVGKEEGGAGKKGCKKGIQVKFSKKLNLIKNT